MEALSLAIYMSSTTKNSFRTYYPYVKNLIDHLFALILLILLSPLILLISVFIKLSSEGPIILVQKRLTTRGKVFNMYKFRTMYQDAETRTGAVWAKTQDPRVTNFGKFLRTSRLDELPQLVNVLKGEMSLIGPRPERPEMAAKLKEVFPYFSRRHHVKSGITGLAQIAQGYASCNESYRRKLALDLLYVRNRCLLLDLRIALRTILVVLTGFGAK